MPSVTVRARDTISLPPVRQGQVRLLTGGAGSVFVENSPGRATLGSAATLDNVTGSVALFNPQTTSVTVTYSDRAAGQVAGVIGSPTAPGVTYSQAEAASMKTTVDALLAAMRASELIA